MSPTKTDGSECAVWTMGLRCKSEEITSAHNQMAHSPSSDRTLHLRDGIEKRNSNEVTGSILKMIAEKAYAPCYSAPNRRTGLTHSTSNRQRTEQPCRDARERVHPTYSQDSLVELSFESRSMQQRLHPGSSLLYSSPDVSSFLTDPVTYLDSDYEPSLEEVSSITDSTVDFDFRDSSCGRDSIIGTDSEVEYGSKDIGNATQGKHRRIISTNLIDLRLVKENKDRLHTVRDPQAKFSIGLPVNAWSSERGSEPNEYTSGTTFSQLQHKRELEYKHRHTFIGTASLDDFLEILEVSSTFFTSRSKVTKAFVSLAVKEQALAREYSTSSEGWELVPRISSPVTDMPTDYLAQSRIKLGSVSLSQFLELLQFNSSDETDAMAVVDAFCSAAHIDGITSDRAVSKARAFRKWMVLRQT